MPLRLGYIIPEFPGQTHIWMWREIEWMRRWCDEVHIYSTRQPPDRDRARHAFAQISKPMTTYLWPLNAAAPAWAAARHPVGLAQCFRLAATLPVQQGRLGVAKLIPSASHLARDVARRGITHLHCHSCANSAVLAMMARRLVGVPYSLTLNASIDWWGGAMAEKFGEAQFTIAISEGLLGQIRHDFPRLRDEQALLGRIGVDTRTWTPQGRKPRAPGEARPFCIASIGRLHPAKGQDDLIRAVERLVNERGRDLSLRLIGDGPHRAELEALAASAGLGKRVTFLGSLSEEQIKAELKTADAFVLATHAEALGVVFMEAMASGVPTIGTRVGGVPEIITDGEDGLLVAPRDVEALAGAIERLIDEPELAQRLAERGREKIVAKFDSRLGAATLYERITGDQAPGEAPASS